MKIAMGPITLARPEWGMEGSSVTSLMPGDSGGYPDVLAAQTLCNAATSGVRVMMLLSGLREEDEVWRRLVDLLGGGDRKSAATALSHLSIRMHTGHTGWERSADAQLVYAPGLSVRELRQYGMQTRAPILVVGEEFDGELVNRSTQVVRVGLEALAVDAEGFEVAVMYDPSGPIYRPARHD